MDAYETIMSREVSASIYARLLATLETIGSFEIEPKKTSVHVVHGRSFLGIHPRMSGLVVDIVTADEIPTPRTLRAEQVSRWRWHNRIPLTSPRDVDADLATWIAQAYALTESTAPAE